VIREPEILSHHLRTTKSIQQLMLTNRSRRV